MPYVLGFRRARGPAIGGLFSSWCVALFALQLVVHTLGAQSPLAQPQTSTTQAATTQAATTQAATTQAATANNGAALRSASQLKTVAESSNYRATASGAECELFLKQLQRLWPASRLESLGESVEGRPIWALIVAPLQSKPATPTLSVLLLGGIHSGECDGKEALLALARDFASGGQTTIPRHLQLIFVPNFNADGNERVGVEHRPAQIGPEDGAGIRENAQGLDLNRDFVKLETPEVRSLVAALNRFDVDVLIDTHTTNGSLHRYDLTYDVPHNPAAPRPIDAWLRKELLPTATKNLESLGMSIFYYGNFDQQHANWRTFGCEPRYSTELMGLRGKIGILVESYSYASYQRRIEVTTAFIREVLTQLDGQSTALHGMLADAAKDNLPGMTVPLRSEMTITHSGVLVRGYQRLDGTPPAPPYTRSSIHDPANELRPHDYRVDLWSSARATREVALPAAYAIAGDYAWALSRLNLQGVAIERIAADMPDVRCESLVVSKVEARAELQEHAQRSFTIEVKAVMRTLPAGTYLVRTSQPLGILASYLLEPESDDGLAAWNFFDPDLKSESEAPVLRVLDELPSSSSVVVSEIGRSERLTLEHLLQPGRSVEYSRSSANEAAWLGNSSLLVMRRDKQWKVVDPSTGSSRTSELLTKMETAFASLEAFKSVASKQRITPAALAPDARFAMLAHDGDLYYYDAQTDVARQLTHTPKEPEALAELSPTGKHVAYVRENDLYVVNCESTEQRRFTKDGSENLLNGILDWVYQEEIYGRGQFRAFWFSPDGRRLAFLQLDQSPVHHYRVTDSIHYRQELEDTRYPKAGEPLPIARVWIADIESGDLCEADLSQFPIDDRLVVRVTWSPANELWLQIQNRVQTEQVIVRVDVASGQLTRILEEKSPGWLEVLGQPKFLPDGDFLWLSDLPDGRRHLSRFDMQSQQLSRLTSGPWDMAEVLSISPDGRTAFVTGNVSHPTETQLISVDTQSGQMKQLTHEAGTHRLQLSHDGRYFIDSWSSLQQAPVTRLRSVDGTIDRVLNAPVSDRYRYVEMATPKLQTIRARDGLELQTLVLLPPKVAVGKETARLPVLFHVYGGPQAPTVVNSWPNGNSWAGGNYWWHQYLCSQGYAVVLCDNRAARGRGIADTWKIHRDMGRVELEDLEDAAAWVREQPWADSQRLGCWGWSYGGYFTAYAMTHSQLFKAGIAGAPVTDWHNYDAIYTERYMDLPKNNPDGYKNSSTVTAADKLHGRLLLVHGERDDNVHVSNTLQLAHALQKAGKSFDMMIYPKNRHGVVEPSQKYHLYQMMSEFLERNLKQ